MRNPNIHVLGCRKVTKSLLKFFNKIAKSSFFDNLYSFVKLAVQNVLGFPNILKVFGLLPRSVYSSPQWMYYVLRSTVGISVRKYPIQNFQLMYGKDFYFGRSVCCSIELARKCWCKNKYRRIIIVS